MKRAFFSLFLTVVVAQIVAQPLPLDYSYCGYKQSEAPIPAAQNVVYVAWQQGNNSERIQRAIDYVSENLSEPISLSMLAGVAGYSLSRFKTRFREQTGQSCKSYITALRMKTACRMLTETGSPVGDIAQSVGYNSASYFIKVFKDLVGETPDVYRKNHQEEA